VNQKKAHLKKKIFILFLFIILTQCKDKSKPLRNGIYNVEFTGEFSIHPSYQVEIRDSLFIDREYDFEKWYKINWISKDTFDLERIPIDNPSQEEFDLLQIRLPFPSKYPYYRIIEYAKDTVFFKYYQGENVSIVPGMFIQIGK
tara:strand:- start:1741 stop:2172 length:432 start_codon:yes stop_codon:yes gene_type:complete